MQTRNDSVLLTGMNSGTAGKIERTKEKARLKKEAKREAKNKLVHIVEPVLEALQKEKDRTTLEILEAVDNFNATDEGYKSQMQALNLYRESMSSLHNRIKTIMRAEK